MQNDLEVNWQTPDSDSDGWKIVKFMLDQVTERDCFIKDFPRNVTFQVWRWKDKRYVVQ